MAADPRSAPDHADPADCVIQLALAAGEKIMAVYDQPVESAQKADGSPVTVADERAEAVILEGLARALPEIPVVAEEAVEAGQLPAGADRYFLVDPLDGTKEFLSRNGEFTVNIALIDQGVPVFGVVLAPALGEIYWGGAIAGTSSGPIGAFCGRVEHGEVDGAAPITVRRAPASGVAVLASRSHCSAETEALIDKLPAAERKSVGSSLKLCWLACGRADFYPRLSPTMQWDIAAGDAVLRAAGGKTLKYPELGDLAYRLPDRAAKADLLNPHFLAFGDETIRTLLNA